MRQALRYLRVLASLKLAVLVIVGLSAALTVGTVLESKYDTASAQYWVYRSTWFRAVLGLLGINIFAVMVSRWPWKRRHAPFLFAHIGILTLLFGSWLTDKYGLDGMMRVSEGDATGVVELPDNYLAVTTDNVTHRVPVPWSPPGSRFKPIPLDAVGVDAVIDDFISRADAEIKFDPAPAPSGTPAERQPYISLKTQGGPMPFAQTFRLWAGDRMWSRVQAGPALLILIPKSKAQAEGLAALPAGRPALEIQYDAGGIIYRARSTAGKLKSGAFAWHELVPGAVIDPGWTMAIQFVVTEVTADARARIEYAPARVAFGPQAPALSAVRVRSRDGNATWVGLGDRTRVGNHDVGYFSTRVVLPFEVQLDHFKIDRYQGTFNPSEYSSQVTVLDPNGIQGAASRTISMNEPLEYRGTTVYQASYEEGDPRPTVSVFSVNRDPGRAWKYAGSLILVLGCILLFMAKRTKRASAGGPS